MNSVVVPLPSFTHTGSAFILMASGLGASPSSLIAPVMLPAVFGSTALAAGAPDGAAELLGAASCLLPPPQAAAVTAMASTGAIRPFIEHRDIEFSPDAADALVTSECQTCSEISRGGQGVKGPAFALRASAGRGAPVVRASARTAPGPCRYHVRPPASVNYRNTRSCIHLVYNHSTGLTGCPVAGMVTKRRAPAARLVI